MTSPNSSPRRSPILSLNPKARRASQRLEAQTQEISQIMDEDYLPRPATVHRGSSYIDPEGNVHDIDHRPFQPIHKLSPNNTKRLSRSPPTPYWETFDINKARSDPGENYSPCGSYDGSVDDAGLGTYVPLVRYNYPPVRALADWSTCDETDGIEAKAPRVDGNIGRGMWRRGSASGERLFAERVGRRQPRLEESLPTKEKLRRTWIVITFCIRLRLARTQRWLTECVQSPGTDDELNV